MSNPLPGMLRGKVYQCSIEVPAEAIDENGHVNNVAYLQWMNEIAQLHFEALGGPDVIALLGAFWVARSHRIEYLRPVLKGDRLTLKTWISSLRGARSHRGYQFEVGDLQVADGETEWVLVDIETGRPRKIPLEMCALIEPHLRSGSLSQ